MPVNEITNDEARFSLLISSLLVQLTESQRQLFAECMLLAANAKDPDLSIFKRTRVPTSEQDFQHLYLSGKNAVIPNLPHPVPRKTSDGTHAYVSFTDVLANELAKATPFDNFHFEFNVVLDNSTPTISSTPAAQSLFMELKDDGDDDGYVLYLWIREWRDDFDPNGTKQARNQVWMNTYTCCPPPNESKGRNTYFMAISAKGEDHTQVERIFEQELKSLSNSTKQFYHGGLKKVLKVKAGKLSACVDRPERSSMFQVGDHNGKFSTYWGHACSVDGNCNENHLPSCHFCRKASLQQHLRSTSAAPVLDGENRAADVLHLSGDASAAPGAPELLYPPGDEPSGAPHPLHSNSVRERCPHNKCSRWNVMDTSFQFRSPAAYPTTQDTRENAPKPPKGREIFVEHISYTISDIDDSNKRQRNRQVTLVNK